MKKKVNFPKYIALAVFLAGGVLFIIRFAGPQLLRLYIVAGYGDCKQNPILCMIPAKDVIKIEPDKEYIATLGRFNFPEPKIQIYMPKEFTVYKNEVKQVYFKRTKQLPAKQFAYLLYRKPNFFIHLFPQIGKGRLKNDYDFVRYVMSANINSMQNIADAFFVIMKCVFSPNLGDQKNLALAKFRMGDKRGYLIYNIGPAGNYFDCNMFNAHGEFFKLFIKDAKRTLDSDKVLAIVSTIEADTIKTPR